VRAKLYVCRHNTTWKEWGGSWDEGRNREIQKVCPLRILNNMERMRRHRKRKRY